MSFSNSSQSHPFLLSIVIIQTNPTLRIKKPMFNQISAKDKNMSKAVKMSLSESMVVKNSSIDSHSNVNVVVNLAIATDSDIHLKNSAKIKKNTSLSVHQKVSKINRTKN